MGFDDLNKFYFDYLMLPFLFLILILSYSLISCTYIQYPNMIKIVKTLFNPKLIMTPSVRFSDVWKERDDAAEKVYITKSERQTMKKLLTKMNKDQQAADTEFEHKLDQILSRYKVQNEAFKAEVLNLHRQL